jgi:tol-pal system protein YbgF
VRYISLLLIILVSACIATTDYDRLRQDVSGLQRDYFEVKSDVSALKDKTDLVVKEDSFAAVRESQTTINTRLSEMSMSLQELRGRFEENRYFLDKTMKDSAADREMLKVELTRLENEINALKSRYAPAEGEGQPSDGQPEAVRPDAGQSPETVEGGTEPPQPEKITDSTDISDEKTLAYESAIRTYKDKNYKDARKMFEAFSRDYPDTTLTDNAQFWIAETYYAEKDYEGSILAYETLLKKYPESDKTSGALMKQGFAFIELGDKKTGRIILEKLIEKFAESPEAEIAQKKLNVLDKSPY